MEKLLAVLKKFQGNRKQTARELGMAPKSIRERIQRAEEGSELAVFNEQKGSKPSPHSWSEESIAEALEDHGGNRQAASRELGVPVTTLKRWIRQAAPDSPIFPFQQKKGWAPLPFTDAQLAKVLTRFNGNRKATARELGISSSNIDQHIVKAAAESPLDAFRNQKGKRGRPRKSVVKAPSSTSRENEKFDWKWNAEANPQREGKISRIGP